MAKPTLNPRKRNKIASRVGAPYDFDIANLNQEQGQRRKQFVKERDSTKIAADMALRATLGTKVPGELRGTAEGRQLGQEIRGRGKDIRRSLPGLLAVAQQDYKSDRAEINQDLRQSQFDRSQAIAEEIAKVLQDKREAQQEAKADTHTAMSEALKLIRQATLGGIEGVPPDKAVPTDEKGWLDFEDELNKQEGVKPDAASRAVARLKRKYGRNEGPIRKGIVPIISDVLTGR